MHRISVVTPTLDRPAEVAELLEHLAGQTVAIEEVVLVDGADPSDTRTEEVAARLAARLPYRLLYERHARGTAVQRNAGLEAATGDLVAFVDDDVRLAPDFLERIVEAFDDDREGEVGGVTGYRENLHFHLEDRRRWRWYRRLRLLTTFEPGRYDRRTGIPINANLQPPFQGVREVDFMTTACTVWRREVFADGMRFDDFFGGFGVLEDAHLALRAGGTWRLLQCGDARAQELSAGGGRSGRRAIGFKCVLNYYYVFEEIESPLSPHQRLRFWLFQTFEAMRLLAAGLAPGRADCRAEVAGRLEAFAAILGARLRRRPLRSLAGSDRS